MSVVTQEHIAFAHKLADAAGEVVRQYFRTPVSVDVKKDDSPVTIADQEVERTMRELIKASYPDHGIYGEEWGVEGLEADYVWVLDPIDGTRSFISGVPLFTTLISLCYKGDPVLGLIDQGISGERWQGIEGQPTTLNGKEISVRACDVMAKATFFHVGKEAFSADDWPRIEALSAASYTTRTSADAYAYGLLALGLVDIVADNTMKPFDYCALVPVIKGAGGQITDWAGRDLTLNSDGSVLATGDTRMARAAQAILQD